MTVSCAWVTSAVEDKVVDKAIILGLSLRKAKTAKKLVVLTTLAVSKELREKLHDVFDLVVHLEQGDPNDTNLEEYAKIQAFSLLVFNKCVYISPQTLVLKNCDEIFTKYDSFAVIGDDAIANTVDSSIFLFSPSLRYRRSLEKIVFHASITESETEWDFNKLFSLWSRNHIPKREKLDKHYIVKIQLNQTTESNRLKIDASIVNFVDIHPLDLSEELLTKKIAGSESIEKFAVEQARLIYNNLLAHDLANPLASQNYVHEPIAIVGLSFRFPGGNNPGEFWDLLVNGREAIRKLPAFRWMKNQVHTVCQDRNVEAGFLNFPIDEFDGKFFGISPKEVVFLDPQQRLLHEVLWEAFENAAIDPLTLHGSQTGVFVGSWIHDYKDITVKSADVDFFRSYMGNSIAATAARISHFLGTTGPSIGTESGCSSGISAVDMACKSLRNQDSNLAVACGVNLLIHPFDSNTLSFIIAPDGRCKTFDAKANGFGRAEGCAVLVMKRYSDALKDKDQIWGLIRGSALTQEGVSKSLGTPTVQGESLAMKLALINANVDPRDVSFVETHGTGTPVGDPMEVAAIAKAYSKGRTDPLVIGSVKTNVGHTESVSGITGIIKVLLAMKNEMIPQHRNLETLNPNINLDAIPAVIPMNNVPWSRNTTKPRIAGVSSFGISGTDGHAIIEEAPQQAEQYLNFHMERPLHILKISAKSQESFDKLLSKYATLLTEQTKGNKDAMTFADIAYSANTGRSTFNYRAVIIAENCEEAAKILKEKKYKSNDIQTASSSLCFLFTGQGSQYPNMAKSLYSTSPVFKTYFDQCDDILERKYNISLREVLWGNTADADALSRTLYSQTSIFCVEYCLLKLWESWGVRPAYVLGHSLGEFAAAVAAEAMNFEDALMLVAERSRLIDSLPRGKMLVIKAEKRIVDITVTKYTDNHPNFWVDYAALNSPDQTVVAGDSEMIENFAQFCSEKGLKSIVLAATHAFHSRHMNPMLDEYKKVASTVKKPVPSENAPKYISGMEGRTVDVSCINADYWVRHTREKVSFIDACKTIQAEGCKLFLEVGPHPVLSALTMMNNEGSSITCLASIRRKEEEWVTLLDSLSKLYLSEWTGVIDWKCFDRYYMRSRVDLPFYPFNRKPVWIKIIPVQAKLHPLLGKMIPTASADTVYENTLTYKNANFVQDHVIGNTVIFPGSGFLEMCLASGHSSSQGFTEEVQMPRRAIALKGLKISTPLALYDSELCRVQTVTTLEEKTDSDEELGYSVSVYRNANSDAGQWIIHASSKFLPVADINKPEIRPFNIANITESWEKSNNKEFYERLPEVGLRFGPKFQSLEEGWKSENEVLLKVKVPEDHASYLIHPVIADAMIQSSMLWRSTDAKKKLLVPVHIGEFIWLTSTESSCRYIFCSKNDNGSTYSILLDDQGTPLAYMGEVDFAETTVKLIEGMIQQQSVAMPKLWEEIWKYSPGPLQNTMDRIKFNVQYPTSLTPEVSKKLAEFNDVGETERNFYSAICELAQYYLLEALYKLGWSPSPNSVFSVDEVTSNLGIRSQHKQYVTFFLNRFAEDGILNALSSNEFSFIVHPPTIQEVRTRLEALLFSNNTERSEYRIISELGKHLNEILVGKIEPLSALFPEDSSKPNAEEFYYCMKFWSKNIITTLSDNLITPTLKETVERMKSVNTSSKPVFRILEVGAGTGVFTGMYLEFLETVNVDVEYYYTDISAAFFGSAEKLLEEYSKSLVFKKLNIEEDPLEQGFCPNYFDMIVGCEVFHIAKNIKETIKRLRPLLKPGGILQILETVVHDPRITFIFGLLEGYWQFQDYELRPNHATLTPAKWKQALREVNFPRVEIAPFYDDLHGLILAFKSDEKEDISNEEEQCNPRNNSWIIFGDESLVTHSLTQKLEAVNRKVVLVQKPVPLDKSSEEILKTQFRNIVRTTSQETKRLEGVVYLWGLNNDHSRDQMQISLPFVTLAQVLSEIESTPPRVYVVTQALYELEDAEILEPSAGTLIGIMRAVKNENVHLNISQLDMASDEPVINQIEELFHNLWDDKGDVRSFRNENRWNAKLVSTKISNEYLSLPNGCDRFKLTLPKTKVISDLEFAFLPHFIMDPFEVEVHVKATALNFRDVFAVLKPIEVFEKFNTVGLDFSGVVTKVGEKVTKLKVGDRVMGMNMSNDLALPSHISITEDYATVVPKGMTFFEGVTLPAVFSTAVYCLIRIAKMKKGETLLVHTASGGVGLCAIQLAKHVGVEIIATAGSKRKRNFVKNLGIQHVFHSRNTDFGKQILEVTNGRGVDIVLNSITGPGFKEASLGALAQNGRFIEMSKLNVWTPEEVKVMRTDVFYAVLDLTTLEKQEYEELAKELQKFLDSDIIKPIPYERFDALNIRGALTYLQKAKHIGKIVCAMPEVKVEKATFKTVTHLFNEDSTYLVTGGLGGIGFQVVKWMVNNGAKHIAIASRSQPKAEIVDQIESWNKSGKYIKAFAIDVGNYDQCRWLFDNLKNSESGFPTVRGVMHAAGVLQDSIIENQTWDKFQQTFNPKVYGTWNLHDLTKHLILEHFVLFSSIAAIFGSPGQANHSASNSFEDTLARYRISNGLPATCVNWGNWGEVGVATEVDFPGSRPISTSQGLLALETFLRTQKAHTGVFNVESFGLLSKVFPALKAYVEDKRLFGETKCNVVIMNSDEFWAEVDLAEGREEKLNVFKDFIKYIVKVVLKMDADEEIDDNTEFQSLGIDSLMMLEMKNAIQNVLGTRVILTAAQLKDCTTSGLLAKKLRDILEGETEEETNLPTLEELAGIVREDSVLPQHIYPNENLSPCKSIDQVENVLLTGATGNLGPYLLRELCQRPHIQKIFCLIRKSGKTSAEERLTEKLKMFELLKDIEMTKIEYINGDIAESRLGLSQENYDRLAEQVDIVIHAAVRALHVSKYWKAPDTIKSHVRTVNVLGTTRILEFAVHKTLKHVYHASTLLTVTGVDSEGQFFEDWQDVGAYDNVTTNLGYPLSKHIAEQLMKQAVERGIPCKVFRLPLLAGHSKTGLCDVKSNHFLIRWLTCMKLKCIPDLPYPVLMMPIDTCAQISLQIFLDNRVPSDVINICDKNPELDQVLVSVAQKFGIEVETVSYSDFISKINSEDENSPIAPFRSMYQEADFADNAASPSAICLQKYIENSTDFFMNRKLSNYMPGVTEKIEPVHSILLRDLNFLKDTGVFEKFGIES